MGNYDIPSSVLPSLTTLVFKDMVYSRLPFLAKNADNDSIISNFFLEECYEMQPCFQIGLDPATGVIDWSKVGVEVNYNMMQKSILADLVSVYIILLATVASTQGNNQGTTPIPPTIKFLSKGKAGSVDVEWKQLSIKELVGFADSSEGLLNKYKTSATRKARTYGCYIDVLEPGVADLVVGLMPLITIGDCGCR